LTARILVVDDVPANVRLLEARLTAEYYEVKSIRDGRDVLATADAWQPDVILLDVMMAEMDGYEVCCQLKAQPTTAHIPVIMVTALRDGPDRLHALSCGADEFMTKPVEHEILLARLRGTIRLKRLLDEWRARGATALALGLTLNAGDASAPSGRALIVDDLLVRATRLRDVLIQNGISATLAQDEAAALQITADVPFDLITISLSMMGGDPLRLVAKMRAAVATRETPLLLVAEPDQRSLLIGGLDLGANDCLTLPLDESEFLLRATNHIRRKQYQDQLRTDVSSALQLAVIDPLTRLYNRRYLISHLDSLCADADDQDFAVLMIDVDNFKAINDRYGHHLGDTVLQRVAETLRVNLRDGDMVARYGGEEFVAVVGLAAGEARAVSVAEKLRAAIEELRIESRVSVTLSIGVAIAGAAPTISSLIEQADEGLYEAKRGGRNRVVLNRRGLEVGALSRGRASVPTDSAE
jgi:two-component system cell cycle response regulator